MANGRAVAPPAGDLVNIRTVDGSPLFGSTGSSFTHIPKGYQGVEAEGLDPLKANLGKYALGQAQGVSDFSAIAPLVPEKAVNHLISQLTAILLIS
ncbi:hypothetical protein PYR77_17910 (plasmid) [Acinetobacter soli]|nr:hypothetical protein [Acinetobacter soli]WEH90972.1 hypothetical protein PYR75_00250 [Acinetobacter soli]WEH99298.1 hypothetical protein PYR76_18425 [Acinetobacter soli]WEI02350.1 hypothetical protein PYR77_17910 [Acinetobacter soli]